MLSFYVFVCSFYRWMAPPLSRLHLQVCFLKPRNIALVVLFSSCILLGWRLTFWDSQRLVNEDVHHFERNLHLISSHISTRYSNCGVHSSNAHLHRSYRSDTSYTLATVGSESILSLDGNESRCFCVFLQRNTIVLSEPCHVRKT